MSLSAWQHWWYFWWYLRNNHLYRRLCFHRITRDRYSLFISDTRFFENQVHWMDIGPSVRDLVYRISTRQTEYPYFLTYYVWWEAPSQSVVWLSMMYVKHIARLDIASVQFSINFKCYIPRSSIDTAWARVKIVSGDWHNETHWQVMGFVGRWACGPSIEFISLVCSCTFWRCNEKDFRGSAELSAGRLWLIYRVFFYNLNPLWGNPCNVKYFNDMDS